MSNKNQETIDFTRTEDKQLVAEKIATGLTGKDRSDPITNRLTNIIAFSDLHYCKYCKEWVSLATKCAIRDMGSSYHTFLAD